MTTRTTKPAPTARTPWLILMCTNGCDRPALTKDYMLCAPCEAVEAAARFHVGDDEGELIARGISTRD